MKLNDEELEIIRSSFLLTLKPILYVGNISEDEIENPEKNQNLVKLEEHAKKEGADVIPLCVKIEEELSGLRKRR